MELVSDAKDRLALMKLAERLCGGVRFQFVLMCRACRRWRYTPRPQRRRVHVQVPGSRVMMTILSITVSVRGGDSPPGTIRLVCKALQAMRKCVSARNIAKCKVSSASPSLPNSQCSALAS